MPHCYTVLGKLNKPKTVSRRNLAGNSAWVSCFGGPNLLGTRVLLYSRIHLSWWIHKLSKIFFSTAFFPS